MKTEEIEAKLARLNALEDERKQLITDLVDARIAIKKTPAGIIWKKKDKPVWINEVKITGNKVINEC